jgi:hypothetical protein
MRLKKLRLGMFNVLSGKQGRPNQGGPNQPIDFDPVAHIFDLDVFFTVGRNFSFSNDRQTHNERGTFTEF